MGRGACAGPDWNVGLSILPPRGGGGGGQNSVLSRIFSLSVRASYAEGSVLPLISASKEVHNNASCKVQRNAALTPCQSPTRHIAKTFQGATQRQSQTSGLRLESAPGNVRPAGLCWWERQGGWHCKRFTMRCRAYLARAPGCYIHVHAPRWYTYGMPRHPGGACMVCR